MYMTKMNRLQKQGASSMERARNGHDQNEQTSLHKEHYQWKELGMYMTKMSKLHKQGASSMKRARNVHDQNEQTSQARSIISGKS